MKKIAIFLLAAAMLSVLSACGGRKDTNPVQVDLQAFFTSLQDEHDWGEGYLVDIEGEMLDSYYPGLAEIETKQFVAKMPTMSAVVNEMVFMECTTEEGAEQAAAILQERIDLQAEGGAWYPESMEAWSRGSVIRHDTYVAMIASAEEQDDIAEDFNELFLR